MLRSTLRVERNIIVIIVMALCMYASQLHCLVEKLSTHTHGKFNIPHHHHEHSEGHNHHSSDPVPDSEELCCQPAMALHSFEIGKKLSVSSDLKVNTNISIFEFGFAIDETSRLIQNLSALHSPPSTKLSSQISSSLSIAANAPPALI